MDAKETEVGKLRQALFLAEHRRDRRGNEAAEKIAMWHHGEPVSAYLAAEKVVAYFLESPLKWPADKTASYSIVDLAAMLPSDGESPRQIEEGEVADKATLDERAATAKFAHQDWNDKQIAEHLGCRRESLFKPHMKAYKAAKAALKARRYDYRADR